MKNFPTTPIQHYTKQSDYQLFEEIHWNAQICVLKKIMFYNWDINTIQNIS